MTVDTKEVVTTIAYMIGVRMSALTVSYGECSELIEKLRADRDATTIRYLCKLRTVLMQKFKKTDDLMRYQLKNLYNIEWYDHDNIKQLEKWGFTIIQANYRSDKYIQDLTKLINENIDKCSHLFYDWLNWEYIRDLFFVPKYNKNGVMKDEFNKYMVYNKFQMGVSLVSSFSGAASQNMACFVAGTLILTTAGLLAIEKLRAGDKVLAADPESFEVGEKTILEAFERKVYKLVHLTINGEKIVTTDNHPFYVQGRGFIKAEGLFVGDKLISVDGKDLIVETHDIEQCEKPITVYNFKVEDYHTYFVGNCKIWVHNNDCVKKVESGEIELETKKQKGNYGEMKMDEHYDSKGFEKMHNGVESLDDKIHHGIDGVYKNKDPNGDPKFIIAEAKYGSSQLGNTKKSGPQMGDKWIKNNIGKIVDDPDDIIEGLATGDTVKELFRVNVSNDNGLVNVTTSVKSLK